MTVILTVTAMVTSKLTSRLLSHGMLCHIIWYGFTDVPQENIATIVKDMESVDSSEMLVPVY
jgi:hypothetical protein